MRYMTPGLAAAVLAAASVLAPPLVAADAIPFASARITYRSGSTIYVDAGSEQGLTEEDVLEVVRGDAVEARARVTYVTAQRASASLDEGAAAIAAGDSVRFRARATDEPVPASTASSPEKRARRDSGIHGRVGVRWLWVNDRTGLGTDLSQPALDLRITGRQIGGAPVDLDADFRPRRTYRRPEGGPSEDESSNRIYQLAAAWRPGSFRVAAGRQYAPAATPLALFDGLSAEYRRSRFAVGALVGTEPDPESWSYDSGVKDYGVYVETGSKPGATTRWWLGSGAISSTTDGEINRDWIYVSARVTRGGLHVFAQQAVDVNRGWREDAEGSSFTSSGTFAAVRWQATPSWSFDAGIDSRRNVRIYRDRVTPATEFDDTYRQGYRAGVQWLGQGRWLVGVDGRTNRGGDAGTADAWTLRLGALDMTSAGLDARLRATTYTGPLVDGTVLDASVSARAGESVRLDVHGGTRSDEDNYGFDESRTISWYGIGVEILPGRHVWITATYDRTTGGDEDNDQAYVTSSWRW